MGAGRFCRSYRAGLNSSTLTGGYSEECLPRYASRIGIDPAVLRPLRFFLWVLHSRSEYQHSSPMLREYRSPKLCVESFVALWEEELCGMVR